MPDALSPWRDRRLSRMIVRCSGLQPEQRHQGFDPDGLSHRELALAFPKRMAGYNNKLSKMLLFIPHLAICLCTLTVYVTPTFGDLAGNKDQEKKLSQTPTVRDTLSSGVVRDNILRRVNTSPYRCRDMEQIVKKVPKNIQDSIFVKPAAYINALVQLLIANQDDEFLKVKNIHDWIADNIAYDVSSYVTGNLPDHNYIQTLTKKASVCAGYASLFQEMCSIAHIECTTINGYARGYGFDVFEDEDPFESNHDWNAVNINHCWYLVDVTWDAGHFDGEKFTKTYSTTHLFLKPEKMIYTHIPTDDNWQLLTEPLNKSEIVSWPCYRGEYFQYGLEVIPGLKKVTGVQDETSIRFNVPEAVYIVGVLIDEKGKKHKNMTFVQKNLAEVQLLIRFPHPGRFRLRLFSGREEYGMYEWVAEFGFIVSDW